MSPLDPFLLVRAGSVYITAVLTAVLWIWRRPSPREIAGALLACCWNLPTLLLLNVVAERWEWWRFSATGGLLLGEPVDLFLAWVWLWGVVPVLAFPAAPLAVVVVAGLMFDLLLMPAAAPVLVLGPGWLVGETIGLLTCLLPAQILARWTSREICLGGRASLQVLAFAGLVMFVLPAIAIDGSGGAWHDPLARPAWQVSLMVQALAVPAAIGLIAVHEFVLEGSGTPVPFDPPRRLVTTGIYAYLRNPMQCSAVLLLLLLGLMLNSIWVASAGVMAHIYSTGLAGWDEDADLIRRFGDRWRAYREAVGSWIPRPRPWYPADRPPSRLYVAGSCDTCQGVARWFEAHGARNLLIVAAETHPTRVLTRVTYETPDGTHERGIKAIGRALEHVHVGWALVGGVLRLPLISPALQLLVDASGGYPRRVVPAQPAGNLPSFRG